MTRRRRSAARRGAPGIKQLPWTRVRNPYAPVEVFTAEQLDKVHDASMRILEEIGIEFMSKQALSMLDKAGAEVDHASGLVKFDRDMVLDLVAKAPSEVTLRPRNPEHSITLGGNHINFGLVAGPPNVQDRVNGRRQGNYEDYATLLKLAQSLNIVHLIGNQPTAPVELPAHTRHLDCYAANVTYTDRVYHCSSIGADRALDGVDIAAIARGQTREDLVDDPAVLTIISVNSPRRFDGEMADGLIAMSTWGQCVVVTPFTLMGAMTPVTLPAALAQQNAEALAGIALTQLARPGSPVCYGAFTSNVDMRTGAPAFGTPENAKAQLAAGQLARRYNLPYRASNANASNAVDAQAAYESEMAIWGGVMGHCNLLYHGAGWLEGGLTASFEKVVLDAELLQMMAETLKPIEVDDDTLALDAIREVGPGGHFFGASHTMERYETAFYAPMLSDWRNYETWLEAGGETAEVRATKIWQTLLENYQQPEMDEARQEQLQAFLARRKEELSKTAA
ncbi:trimethylamine methyltransferase family protein [Ferruginivarius sediminum]|uniref:Methyltransferase n=1 Tax=Ferruginivarius sediminum TaxID=2661937 RepID=A0A369T8J1_9PROT|nr:trimethylamine methyltransferase family protein [Ferruginivarius sediminum]RDD61212.1 methyltransferase [Ferruginivarius sediminum]